MKKPIRLVLLLAVLPFAGCETASELSQGVRGRLAEREAPRVRVASTEPRATYEAVRMAATQMGYRFQRGGPAQGEFEAVSAIGLGDTPGSSRQISMKVKLQPTLDGKGTRISLRLSEIIEADSSRRAGLATETPLRDTPQHEVFFQRVAKLLGVPVEADMAH